MLTLTTAIVFDASNHVLVSRTFEGSDLGQLEALATRELSQFAPRDFIESDACHFECRIVEPGQSFGDGKLFMDGTPWQELDFDDKAQFGWSIRWPFDTATVATR